ncbi:hypothetical protein [Mesorhizobium sp. M0276]|uniref:DUF7192 family protein n=1 Tax=Mesorhizobium sp. M0276 TaxID=2956928 RepID=UPI003336F191
MARSGSEYGFQDPRNLIPGDWKYRPTIHHRFTDAEDVIALAARETSQWKQRASRSVDLELGTRTWDEAVALARYGWPAGRHQLVRDLNIHATLTKTDLAPRWSFDYAGAYPDVPRFLGGEMDCMVDTRPDQRAVRPIVRIAVSPITFSHVKFEAVSHWGAALVSWIDELEYAGQRVEVTWISCSKPDTATLQEIAIFTAHPRFTVSFCLKKADQPLEIDRLAFWIMHLAAQRRIQFAVKEQFPAIEYAFQLYGQPEQNPSILAPLCSPDTLILMVGEGAASVAEGLEWLRKTAATHFENTYAAT